MLHLDTDGRLQLARERAAELAEDYGRRKRRPEPREAAGSASRRERRGLRLLLRRSPAGESAGA